MAFLQVVGVQPDTSSYLEVKSRAAPATAATGRTTGRLWLDRRFHGLDRRTGDAELRFVPEVHAGLVAHFHLGREVCTRTGGRLDHPVFRGPADVVRIVVEEARRSTSTRILLRDKIFRSRAKSVTPSS